MPGVRWAGINIGWHLWNTSLKGIYAGPPLEVGVICMGRSWAQKTASGSELWGDPAVQVWDHTFFCSTWSPYNRHPHSCHLPIYATQPAHWTTSALSVVEKHGFFWHVTAEQSVSFGRARLFTLAGNLPSISVHRPVPHTSSVRKERSESVYSLHI